MKSKQITSKKQLWTELNGLAKTIPTLRQLFDSQPDRGSHYQLKTAGLYFDYSKQLINEAVFSKLIDLAISCNLKEKINHLQQGVIVNPTENRAALHTALRLPRDASLVMDGKDINVDVQASLDKADIIANRVRDKIWRGFSGKSITDVVNIGVGGSDLGPLMVVDALSEMDSDYGIRLHFISNMDGTQLSQQLKHLNPETTLFIISSKSFSTIDTFSNADTAMEWMLQVCSDKSKVIKNHFLGVSASPDKMSAWGLPVDNQLLFWEWVGGRFSLWSSIGLAIAIKFGMDVFRELLAGAYEMDTHFATADFENNLPVILGLLGVWNSTFLDINAHTVLPYDGRLKFFPKYLMQLEMESNGKSVNLAGELLDYDTAPVMWGDVGSNAQHAFYQLLHQGSQHVSCDFIAPVSRYSLSQAVDISLTKQHHISLANCLAQSRVLAFGNIALESVDTDEYAQHKTYRGNQPSTTILLDELTPKTLGSLIALYEHKVYVMSVIWDINPFDQWGVEVGKVMATKLYESIKNKQFDYDDSTNQLLHKICGHDIY